MNLNEHYLINAVRDKDKKTAIEYANNIIDHLKDTPKCRNKFNIMLIELNGIFYWDNVKFFTDPKTIGNFLGQRRKFSKKISKVNCRIEMIRILMDMVDFYCATDDSMITDCKNPIIKNLLIYVKNNCDQSILLNDLSESFHISRSYLSYLIKTETGKSLPDILLYFRLNKARDYLENTNYSIGKIAENCGFRSPSYFCKLFKNEYGISPKQYQTQYLNQQKIKK